MLRSSWNSGAVAFLGDVGIHVAPLAVNAAGDGLSAGSEETTV